MRVSMHRRLLPLIVVFAMLASFVPVLPAAAIMPVPKTIYVDSVNGSNSTGDGSADNPYLSISRGLGDADYGDTIDIAPGTYSADENGETFPLPITASKITLRGSDPYECIIDAEWSDTIVWMMDGSEFTISGLTLTHGYAESGGAVGGGYATLEMSDCILTENFAENGGAVFAIESTVTLTDCELTDNGESAMSIVPDTLEPQTPMASYQGGAISAIGSTLQLLGTTVGNNAVEGPGGGVYLEASQFLADGSTFYENTVVGADTLPASAENLLVDGMLPAAAVIDAPVGGAIFALASDASITDCGFWGNSAFIGSSVLGLDSAISVDGSWFEGDLALAGTVANLSGDIAAGAVDGATAELSPTNGFLSSTRIEGSTFQFNMGSSIIVQETPLLVSNCLITENTAQLPMVLVIAADGDIVNTTLAGNENVAPSIVADSEIEPTAVVPDLPEVRVTNSIVWDEYEGESSVEGVSVEYSDLKYLGEVTPNDFDESVISEDPEFVDAEDGDYSLSASSPCIDSGYDFEVAPDTDIDGTPRPIDGDVDGDAQWDMGAYEFGSVTDGRIEGSDRYETGVAISQDNFASADTAVLATGRVFADGLAAAGLAGAYNAPILLTNPRVLPAPVAAELLRLGVSRVIVCGDQRAISDSVVAQIEALGDIEVERIGGKDRYETASLLADEIVDVTGEDPGLVFVARGDTFPDALAVSPIAWAHSAPILLVRPDELPRYTVDFLFSLTGTTKGVIVGGSAAVSLGVQGELAALGGPAFDRISGDDRYDTAAEVAYWASDEGMAGFGVTGVATGEDFADALCAGPGIGANGGVLLLTPKHTAAPAALAAISSNAPEISVLQIFGSSVAIDDDVAEELNDARRDR